MRLERFRDVFFLAGVLVGAVARSLGMAGAICREIPVSLDGHLLTLE